MAPDRGRSKKDSRTEVESHEDASPENASKAVVAPPPESHESTILRRLVIASFWAAVLVLGLPMWWRTTTIYRATLPFEEMQEWTQGVQRPALYNVPVWIEARDMKPKEALGLVKEVREAFEDDSNLSGHYLDLQILASGSTANEDASIVFRLTVAPDGKKILSTFQAYEPILDILYPPQSIHSPSSEEISPLAQFLISQLDALLSPEELQQEFLVFNSEYIYAATASARITAEENAKLLHRTSLSLPPSSAYHLTISLFTPTSTPSSWSISSALSTHLHPLLRALQPVANITVDTQIQLYATSSPSLQAPTFSEDLGSWTLPSSALPAFINSAEWPLSPSPHTDRPTLNFLIYVPDPATSPLNIVSDDNKTATNAFLLPPSTGVTILNPPPRTTYHHLPPEAIQPALHSISSQLLALLGVPPPPGSLPFRLRSYMRICTATSIIRASSNLGSLARLSQNLKSMPIPRDVANRVRVSLSSLQKARLAAEEGRFTVALREARIAENEAKQAFFDRRMVSQAYFPDEHRIAVYLPFLGPVGAPLLISVAKEVKAWLALRRAKRQV